MKTEIRDIGRLWVRSAKAQLLDGLYFSTRQQYGVAARVVNNYRRAHRGRGYGRAGWLLPDGSMRGAPVSWVLNERKGFARIAPDFIVEVMPAFDDPIYMRAKMEQWIANGVQAAWVIEGDEERMTIYRAGRDAKVIVGAEVVRGDGAIAGFELKMARIWSGRFVRS